MYSEDVSGFDLSSLGRAWCEWRSRNSRFPLPADLLNILSPPVIAEDEARQLSSRVIAALHRFGSNGRAARDFLGEFTWEVVGSQGDWTGLAWQLGRGELKLGVLQAQIRDLALAKLRRRQKGFGELPQLGSLPGEGLALVSSLAASKALPETKKRKGVDSCLS